MPGARGTQEQKENCLATWRLITDLPVCSRKDALEKLEWNALRWKIEVFHKILKSGCRDEEAKLRTAQRLTNLLPVFSILRWPVFWMTMLNCSASDARSDLALEVESISLDHLVRDRDQNPRRNPIPLSDQNRLAWGLSRPRQRLSTWKHGHVARAVRLSRLTDIELGAQNLF
jgi:hypothetical protein